MGIRAGNAKDEEWGRRREHKNHREMERESRVGKDEGRGLI